MKLRYIMKDGEKVLQMFVGRRHNKYPYALGSQRGEFETFYDWKDVPTEEIEDN